MAEEPEYKPGVPLRPQRVRVEVPVRYRRIGDELWSVGRTENFSRTGVLIRAARMLPLRTHVEMTFQMPMGLIAGMSGQMMLTGTVARHLPATGGSPGIGVALDASLPASEPAANATPAEEVERPHEAPETVPDEPETLPQQSETRPEE